MTVLLDQTTTTDITFAPTAVLREVCCAARATSWSIFPFSCTGKIQMAAIYRGQYALIPEAKTPLLIFLPAQ